MVTIHAVGLFLDHLAAEWHVITGAPLLSVTFVLLALAGARYAAKRFVAGRIASKDAEIAAMRAQIQTLQAEALQKAKAPKPGPQFASIMGANVSHVGGHGIVIGNIRDDV